MQALLLQVSAKLRLVQIRSLHHERPLSVHLLLQRSTLRKSRPKVILLFPRQRHSCRILRTPCSPLMKLTSRLNAKSSLTMSPLDATRPSPHSVPFNHRQWDQAVMASLRKAGCNKITSRCNKNHSQRSLSTSSFSTCRMEKLHQIMRPSSR